MFARKCITPCRIYHWLTSEGCQPEIVQDVICSPRGPEIRLGLTLRWVRRKHIHVCDKYKEQGVRVSSKLVKWCIHLWRILCVVSSECWELWTSGGSVFWLTSGTLCQECIKWITFVMYLRTSFISTTCSNKKTINKIAILEIVTWIDVKSLK